MKTLLAFIFCFSSTAHAFSPELPKLFFSYSWLYDSVACPDPSPKDAWREEVRAKTESFSKLWETRGPVLFQVLFNHTGLGFARKEMTATLSLCSKLPSLSNPLVLNVANFLESYMSPRPVLSDDDFVDLVFHELLHSWVGNNLETSALRKKYRDEIPSVRSHLHLMAIQKFVYLKLQRPDLVQMLDLLHARLGGSYARAWEIVGLEGHEAFMNEFLSQNP